MRKSLSTTCHRNLSILYTNADQFVCKRDDLCMRICNDEPDIILITEAIPKAQKLPIAPAQLHVPDYTLYTNFTPSSENLGASGLRGVCIYAKNYLRVSQVYLTLGALSVEHLWVKIQLTGSDCLLLGCIYRSPSSAGEEHARHLEQLFQEVTAMTFSHLVITAHG